MGAATSGYEPTKDDFMPTSNGTPDLVRIRALLAPAGFEREAVDLD